MPSAPDKQDWTGASGEIAELGHKVNGCLQIALGSAELVATSLDDSNPDKETLDEIVNNCVEAVQLVHRINQIAAYYSNDS